VIGAGLTRTRAVGGIKEEDEYKIQTRGLDLPPLKLITSSLIRAVLITKKNTEIRIFNTSSKPSRFENRFYRFTDNLCTFI
jgi:hypothetical protein